MKVAPLLVLLLSGCAALQSPQERAMGWRTPYLCYSHYMATQDHYKAIWEREIARRGAVCTESMIVTEYQMEQQRIQANNAVAYALLAGSRPQPAPPPLLPTIRCFTQYTGSQSYTTCR